MSLHATTTPEAQAKLDTQRRNASISSFTIAVLSCILIVAILFYIAMKPIFKNDDPTLIYTSPSKAIEKHKKPEMKNEVVKKPTTPAPSTSKFLLANISSPISVPVPETEPTEPSLNFGNDADFDDSDIGHSGSPGAPLLPRDNSKRCSKKDRIDRLTKEGGKEDYEDQVVNALRWLQKNQAADGSWKAQGKPVAMTGLALLAYLGHCETPASPEFGETVLNAIIYLINVSQKNGGKLATNTTHKQWCYEHSIATYALAEAYTLCKAFKIPIPGLREAVLQAGNHIIGNQHQSGGWDYSYDTSGTRGGDTSIACWHLQALKACKTTKIEFNGLEKSAKKGIKYLEAAKNGKGTIGYGTNGNNLAHGPTMTPGGALCLQQWGKGNRSLTRNAIKWINSTNDFDYKKHANLYMHYYSCQAMINARGQAWTEYNKKTMTNLAAAQNTDGSWPLPGGAAHGMSTKHYATCLSILMMEVYYRFLPSSE